jgi:hypothetical protein
MTAEMRLRLDAGGTVWRLRSLVAMGHCPNRIARALDVRPETVRRLVRGDSPTVTAELWDSASQLWNAWWDKRPPERTACERRDADMARSHAARMNWCPPLGLDEDELDEPGYRPYSRYRVAAGAGIAGEFQIVASARSSASLACRAASALAARLSATSAASRG